MSALIFLSNKFHMVTIDAEHILIVVSLTYHTIRQRFFINTLEIKCQMWIYWADFLKKILSVRDDAVICFFAFETVFEACLTFQYKVLALFCHSRPKHSSIACYIVCVTPKWSSLDSLITFQFRGISIWLWFNLWVWGNSRLLIGRDNLSILLFLGGIAMVNEATHC